MNDYEPIACSLYDVLEIAIMHRSRLAARWREPDGSRGEGTLRPLDLRVRDGAEWLLARDERGMDVEVRLDRLESARPVD
jgi:Rho-binding antiterminator